MNSIGPGHETHLVPTDGNVAWKIRFVGGSTAVNDIHLIRCDTDGVEVETTMTIDWSAGTVAFSAADLTIPDDAVDSAQIADAAVDPVHLAATVIAGIADAAVAILNTTTHITLLSSTGDKAITTTSSVSGQIITLRCGTVSGGSYTLAVTGGTLTLNSTGEAATIKRVGAAWEVTALTASSSTGANIATIV